MAAVLALTAALLSPRLSTPSATAESSWQTKSIEEIVVGDEVLAWDEATNEVGLRRVVHVFRNMSDHLRTLVIKNADGDEQALETTDGHPFWVNGRGWVDAGELQVGDRLLHSDGGLATLTESIYTEHPEGIPIFNFEVEGSHTYYVCEIDGGDSIRVHNRSRGRRGSQRKGPRKPSTAAKTRAENIAKGIPAHLLGPSGKPKINCVDHPTRKQAKDAARRDSKTTPIKHPSDEGQPPHYHATDQDGNKIGKQSPHHNYPPSQR